MDYRRFSTKLFVKSCQLQDKHYYSVLPSLTKPGLANAPLWFPVAKLSFEVQVVGQMSLMVRTAMAMRSGIHPCVLSSRTEGICHSRDFLLTFEAVERRLCELVLTVPAEKGALWNLFICPNPAPSWNPYLLLAVPEIQSQVEALSNCNSHAWWQQGQPRVLGAGTGTVGLLPLLVLPVLGASSPPLGKKDAGNYISCVMRISYFSISTPPCFPLLPYWSR